jgi:hypothetical protein
MHMPRLNSLLASIAIGQLSVFAYAYEINNHADMSQTAALKSTLNNAAKLNKLGLRGLPLIDSRQRLSLAPISGALPEIRYCFGEFLPGSTARVYEASAAGRLQDPTIEQPDWAGRRFTIAQLIRYGACFEDSESPFSKPLSHFYSVQQSGAGLTTPAGTPNSLVWSLRRGEGNGFTGSNHYTWQDARDSLHQAITLPTTTQRSNAWGVTFQALGHIQHHLQDMASPQHVRNDPHCNATVCAAALQYRPSGYEYYFDQRFQIIRNLAASASTPIMFGLPREFWNANTANDLTTTNPTRAMNANEGIAAYTSTNFVSAGKDFRVSFLPTPGGSVFQPADGLPFPRPAPSITNVPIANLFSAGANLERVRVSLCGGNLANCKMRFVGTETEPSALASSLSATSQELLRPNGTYGGGGLFQQNFFTYTDAAIKLVPKAVEYSAGLIDYFFRGEMEVRLPTEGVYGIIDGGDPASNCKDACGFKRLKVRLKNVTAPINGVAQDFVGGTMTAVVKFSRNSCFQSDFSADPGPLYPFNPSCFLAGSEPIEEQVIADAIPSPFNLASGSEVALTLNFTNPIPINAWNIKLQFVYRGQLGQEEDGVAVHTHRFSSPTPLRYTNEYDYLLINQQLYTRAQVNTNQTLLSQVVPTSCVIGAAGSRQLAASCFNPQTVPTSWTGANGVVLASLNALPTNTHALWVYLIDYFGQTSATFPGPDGTVLARTFFARDLISLDADSSQVGGDFLAQWRNLQVWQNYSRYYLASADQTAPPLAVFNQRPAFPTTTPVKMTSVNF